MPKLQQPLPHLSPKNATDTEKHEGLFPMFVLQKKKKNRKNQLNIGRGRKKKRTRKEQKKTYLFFIIFFSFSHISYEKKRNGEKSKNSSNLLTRESK